ncbi:hypothetical protein FXB40_12320 [Bradyrhizobium rifense]|uniref:Uncharacterized protein n=1 Tax=Bradyrhizobium rifense TaxID=515499 RepID=A0A5D3KKP1_9BRAD|nr:hypothetical protein FXB40_12320 [Bradyrhizobium rifense]
MARKADALTAEEFASLLVVGNVPPNGRAPIIPAAHIALGYMVFLSGRLRITNGRVRIYAEQPRLAET